MKRKSLFKSSITVLSAAAMVIALVGCGNGASTANTQTASKTESGSIALESEANVEAEEINQEEDVEDPRVTWALENEENLEFNFFVFNNETQEKTILENEDRCFLNENETLMFHAKEEYSEFTISGAILQKLEFLGKSTVIVPLLDFSGEEELYFACGDKEASIVILSEEDILISEETPEVEIPEGLTYEEFIRYMDWEIHNLGDCEFIIWNQETGSGRIVTGETVSIDDVEKLTLFVRSTEMNIDLITGDLNIGIWPFGVDRLLEVNSPGEITFKVTNTETNEEYEISCIITE